jgi:hypothetical protein
MRIFTVGTRAFCTEGAAIRHQQSLSTGEFRMVVPFDLLLLDPEERAAAEDIIKTLNALQGNEG